MTKSVDVAIKTLASLVLIIVIGAVCFFAVRFIKCFPAAQQIESFPTYDMVHVVVYGVSDDTVSARFTIYNVDGKEIATIERSWNAEKLFIDFSSACFGGREFLFPYKVYGDPGNKKWSGTLLSPYYMENGTCLLMSNAADRKSKRALYALGKYALARNISCFNKFSNLHTVNLTYCAPGKEYAMYTYSNGTITLIEVDTEP